MNCLWNGAQPVRSVPFVIWTILFLRKIPALYLLRTFGFQLEHYTVATALSMVPLANTRSDGKMPHSIWSTCHCKRIVLEISLEDPKVDNKEGWNDALSTRVINCHCQNCRRYHTGAFASFLETDPSQIIVHRGADKIGRFRANCEELGSVHRLYCRDCSSKLLTVPFHISSTIGTTILKNETSNGDFLNRKKVALMAPDKAELSLPKQKCLVNLGPVLDEGLTPKLVKLWKDQLERPKRNRNNKVTSAVWLNSLPERTVTDTIEPLQPPLKWSGGCACGACRYDFILFYPTELQHCYCHLCRELSGSPFMTWIPVEKEDFHWNIHGTEGSEETMSSETSPLQLVRTTSFGSRHICRLCRSVMTIVYDEQPNQIWPCAGSLDDSSLPDNNIVFNRCLSRVCHICCRYHPTWLTARDDGMERIQEAC